MTGTTQSASASASSIVLLTFAAGQFLMTVAVLFRILIATERPASVPQAQG